MTNDLKYNHGLLDEFNQTFIEYLKSAEYIEKKRRFLAADDDDISTFFPEKDKLWLHKELSKWKRRVDDNTFHGTLQSLKILCRIAGKTPNEILLSNDDVFLSKSINLLSKEDINLLCMKIKENPNEFINVCTKNGCLPLQIPVFYSPKDFSITFFCIKYSKRNATSPLDDLDACFLNYDYSMTDLIYEGKPEEELVIRGNENGKWFGLKEDLEDKINEKYDYSKSLICNENTIYQDSIFDDCGKILLFLLKNSADKISGDFFKLIPVENLDDFDFRQYEYEAKKESLSSQLNSSGLSSFGAER